MRHVTLSFVLRLIVLVILGAALVKEFAVTMQARSEAASIAAEASARTGTGSRTQRLRALKQSEADDIARLDKVAVTKTELVDVISQIESFGKSLGLGVTIASISGGTSSATGTPMTVKIAVDSTGTWASNLTLLHMLENLPYKASVDDAKLAQSDKGWRGNYTFALTVLNE
ncbi:hypothetical protein KW800_00790 [Candidatus Parcubacteria bacterium]|nr:hypothetical protein [Candidatus Parcubacteria bacterium]